MLSQNQEGISTYLVIGAVSVIGAVVFLGLVYYEGKSSGAASATNKVNTRTIEIMQERQEKRAIAREEFKKKNKDYDAKKGLTPKQKARAYLETL